MQCRVNLGRVLVGNPVEETSLRTCLKGLSSLFIDAGIPGPLRVASFPRQAFLNCVRKLTEYKMTCGASSMAPVVLLSYEMR